MTTTVPKIPLYLREHEVSELISIPTGTLRNWRSRLKGPPFKRAHGVILYPRDRLIRWIEEGK